jgi:uncharacterized protein (DUF2164 family)
MKKSIIIAASILATTMAHAQKVQEKEIPAEVKSSFTKHFAAAKNTKWEKEEGNYEAEFDLNKTEQSALFDAKGTLLETEVEIELSQLPAGVLEYVKAHYANQTIKEAAKITDANGTVTYEAEIKGMDLIFDSSGKFVKELKD